VTVAGTIGQIDKTGANTALVFVKGCKMMIFAEGNLKACKRGAPISARGRVQLYDLYPGMEAFFINPRKVSCG